MTCSFLQQKKLEVIYNAMLREYTVRRRMLVERAKVTLQSFLWTDWLKEQGTAQQAEEAAARSQAAMSHEPAVALGDVFQARIGGHPAHPVPLFGILTSTHSMTGKKHSNLHKPLNIMVAGDVVAVMSGATSGDKSKFESSVKKVIIGQASADNATAFRTSHISTQVLQSELKCRFLIAEVDAKAGMLAAACHSGLHVQPPLVGISASMGLHACFTAHSNDASVCCAPP